jgi:hypothetical protein
LSLSQTWVDDNKPELSGTVERFQEQHVKEFFESLIRRGRTNHLTTEEKERQRRAEAENEDCYFPYAHV